MGTVAAKEISQNRTIDLKPKQREPNEMGKKETKPVDLKSVSARVDRINVEGLARTKDDVIHNSVKELFKSQNFEEMLRRARIVRHRLQNLGCFQNIVIHIDTSEGPDASPNGYEVTYEVHELKRLSGGVSSHISDNEGGLIISMALPNMLGRGESLKGEYSYGSKRSKTFNISLNKPFISKWDSLASVRLFQNDFEFPKSGYKVIDRGLLLDFGLTSWAKIRHNFQWIGNWREIGVGNRYTSFEVREDAGNSLKSSLRHVMSRDRRDSPIFPTYGTNFKFITEFAGLGGSVAFFKNEINFQRNWPLFSKDFVIQFSLNCGAMNYLNPEKQPVICDNFFLGGPLSLRGFDFRSVGPQTDGNYTGGQYYWSTGLHVYTPLPFKPGAGGFGDLLRMHFFLNAGNLEEAGAAFEGEVAEASKLKAFLNHQRETFRLAYGLGLALRLGHMARVELNFCLPAFYSPSDNIVSGFQFGVGVDFV